MKTTVTITSRSVATLPAKLRLALGLKADVQMIAESTLDGLMLRPALTLPVELYASARERAPSAAKSDFAARSSLLYQDEVTYSSGLQ
jgi:bifunctional DNA-binding transcriptional regulator/antitoxin component of YhaV-PrlF toxin-antitoxin module